MRLGLAVFCVILYGVASRGENQSPYYKILGLQDFRIIRLSVGILPFIMKASMRQAYSAQG